VASWSHAAVTAFKCALSLDAHTSGSRSRLNSMLPEVVFGGVLFLSVYCALCFLLSLFGPSRRLTRRHDYNNPPLHRTVHSSYVAGVGTLLGYNANNIALDGECGLSSEDHRFKVIEIQEVGKMYRDVALFDVRPDLTCALLGNIKPPSRFPAGSDHCA